MDLLTLIATTKIVPSKKEGRRLIEQGGVLLNDEKVTNPKHGLTTADFDGDGCLIKKGKKNYYLVKIK